MKRRRNHHGTRPAHIALVLVLAWAGACGDPSVDTPDGGGFRFDAGTEGTPPERPTLQPLPAKVPYPVATLHGSTTARRIIVEGGGNPIASTVLPDNTFCVDVPMRTPDVYTFEVFAQSSDGRISSPAGPITVEFDPRAPGISGAQTCSGADPAGCPSATEICGNNRDDNCNSLVDGNDPACATCTDDPLEPNDGTDAPRIDPGRYESLKICPANQDYFGIFARESEVITIRAFFRHADGNLDLHLLGLDRRRVLARSVSLDDDESITHTATTTGEYKIRVFSDSGASNTYTLDVRVM